MSTLQEIEAALARSPAAEREAFESRLLARRFGLGALASDEYRDLLASLDEAEQDIDAGRGITAESLRQKIATWAGK